MSRGDIRTKNLLIKLNFFFVYSIRGTGGPTEIIQKCKFRFHFKEETFWFKHMKYIQLYYTARI